MLVGFGVTCIAFALVRFLPGDPAQLLLGDMGTPEKIREYREVLGLNGSIAEQFSSYLGGVIQGDLGKSLVTRQSVTSVVARTLPVTLWLIAVTTAMGALMAAPLGVVAAIYRRTWFGQLFRVVTSVFLAMPTFFSGLVAILLFSIQFRLAPVAGYDPAFPANIGYLWLPALVTCGIMVPILARVLQASIVETLEQEFVETAIVRGLPRHVLVWRYLLRPSLAPTVGLFGYIVGQMLGAAVVIEIIFGLPGIGTALIDAVLARDYSLVQGIILVFGIFVVAVSYVTDSLSAWLDPRTKSA